MIVGYVRRHGWGLMSSGISRCLIAVVATIGQDPSRSDYVVCGWAWWSAAVGSGINSYSRSFRGAVFLSLFPAQCGE